MVGNTRVFVSSTCFDLDEVRANLKHAIESIGHCAVLSEYPSFPVSPSDNTIENCLRIVREETDIFVLIIGTSAGSTDPASGKTIVNREYETAKDQGIDRFVFVKKQVDELLPLWERNPDADFSSHVKDADRVFGFLREVRSDGAWIFKYDRADDIATSVRGQLSALLRDLIVRKRTGRLNPVQGFEDESDKAKRIVLEKPKYWVHLLTEELLRQRFKAGRTKLEQVQDGFFLHRRRTMSASEFLTWSRERNDELQALITFLTKLIEEKMHESWGKPGEPGDPIAILDVANQFKRACDEVISWEMEIRSIKVPEAVRKLKGMMYGWADHLMSQFEGLPDELARPFAPGADPEGEYFIKLTLEASPNLDEVLAEMKRIPAMEWAD